MKMIYAIVHSEDGNIVTEELTKKQFSVTKLATTGGFLRKGNTTLIIGTEAEHVQEAIAVIRKECGERQHINYNIPYTGATTNIAGANFVPVTVDVGGATIFVLDVEHYEKV